MSMTRAERTLVWGVVAWTRGLLTEDELIDGLSRYQTASTPDQAFPGSQCWPPADRAAVDSEADRWRILLEPPPSAATSRPTIRLTPALRLRIEALGHAELGEALRRLAPVVPPGKTTRPAPPQIDFADFGMKRRLRRLFDRDLPATVAPTREARTQSSGLTPTSSTTLAAAIHELAPSQLPNSNPVPIPEAAFQATPPASHSNTSNPAVAEDSLAASPPGPHSKVAPTHRPDDRPNTARVAQPTRYAGTDAAIHNASAHSYRQAKIVISADANPTQSDWNDAPPSDKDDQAVRVTFSSTAAMLANGADSAEAAHVPQTKDSRVDRGDFRARLARLVGGRRGSRERDSLLNGLLADYRILVHEALATGSVATMLDEALGLNPRDRRGWPPEAFRSLDPAEEVDPPSTPASEVYRLGVGLYVILTGRPPGGPDADDGQPGRRADIARRIVEGDFPTPSQLNPSVPLPWERLCLKALSLAADSRHAHPTVFARELDAIPLPYAEPINGPLIPLTTAHSQARSHATRPPGAVAGSTASPSRNSPTASPPIASPFTSPHTQLWMNVGTQLGRAARLIAQAAWSGCRWATQRYASASPRVQVVLAALLALAGGWIAGRLTAGSSSAAVNLDPETRDPRQLKRDLAEAQRTLDDLLIAFQRDPHGNDPAFQSIRERFQSLTRQYYQSILDDALPLVEHDPGAARRAGRAQLRLAILDETQRRDQDAFERYRQAVDWLSRGLEVATTPPALEDLGPLADAQRGLARTALRRDDVETGLKALEKAANLWATAAHAHPEAWEPLEQHAIVELERTRALRNLGDIETADRALATAERLCRDLALMTNDTERLQPLHQALGALLVESGRGEAARDFLPVPIASQTNPVVEAAGRVDDRLTLARTVLPTGRAYRKAGRHDEALAEFTKAIETLEPLTTGASPSTEACLELSRAFIDRAASYRSLHKDEAAEIDLKRAVALLEPIASDTGDATEAQAATSALVAGSLARARASLGDLAWDRGEPDEARAAYQRAVGDRRRADLAVRPGNSGHSAANDPEEAADLVAFDGPALLVRLARIARLYGRHDEAEALLTQAVGARTRQLGDLATQSDSLDPLPGHLDAVQRARLLDLSATLNQWAEQLAERERAADSERCRRQAMANLIRLVKTRSDDTEARQALAATRSDLARLYFDAGKPVEAEPLAQQAIQTLRALADASPNALLLNPTLVIDLARAEWHLSLCLEAQGKIARAEEAALAAHDRLDALTQARPEAVAPRIVLAAVCNQLGGLRSRSNQNREAVRFLTRALELQSQLVEQFPKRLDYAVELGRTQRNVGGIYHAKNQANHALTFYDDAIATLNNVLSQRDSQPLAAVELTRALWGKALALSDLDRHAEAATVWNQALARDDGRHTVQLEVLKALTLARMGDHAGAANLVEAALKRPGERTGDELHHAAWALCEASQTLRRDGSLSETERRRLVNERETRAVELLTRAQQAGYYADPSRLAALKTASFDSLRERADFRSLMGAAEAAALATTQAPSPSSNPTPAAVAPAADPSVAPASATGSASAPSPKTPSP